MSEYVYATDEHKGHWLTGEEIVRCRDCKFGVDGGKYCAEGCADSWDWRNVEPDGFCAWGEKASNFATCECGEDIELGNRESAVCPRCNRTVRA